MSRPIYEPSDQRTAARLNYGQEQLFRRPASSGCPCDVDAALAYDSTTGGGTGTVDNNTATNIQFDQVSLATGTQAFAIHNAVTANDPFKAILNGWYLGFINFEWSGSPYTDVRSYSLFINGSADNVGDPNVVQSESSPFLNSAFNGTFGPLYIRAADLGPSYFRTRVQHAAGSTQTVTGVEMTVVFLGPDLDPARWPPF